MPGAESHQHQAPSALLKPALTPRQLRMIAMGGVIGAGLFVGSGVVLADTGPAAFITYALAGVLIVLVMRMLAEMAFTAPSAGSFADYTRQALGDWAGFSVGWLYWYFWVIVVGFEAIAGAKIIQFWIDVPVWGVALGLLAVMTLTNLFSVSAFGEFEFWFAGIKVAAIIVFIGIGSLYVSSRWFGDWWPGGSPGLSNLSSHGGLFPLGAGAVTVAVVTVIFSMVGSEIITVAAAESADPRRAVARAAQAVVVRITVFFVASALLLATIVPWDQVEPGASPFVEAFSRMGIPHAGELMNAVVLTAVLSCLNSGIYGASRMVFVLAIRGEAPRPLRIVSSQGVPVVAVLASTAVGLVCVIAAAFSPDTIFAFLLNSSGAIILFVYLLIVASQIALRRRAESSPSLRIWLFPGLSILTGASILAILVQMYLQPTTRSQLLLGLASWAVALAVFAAARRRGVSRGTNLIENKP